MGISGPPFLMCFIMCWECSVESDRCEACSQGHTTRPGRLSEQYIYALCSYIAKRKWHRSCTILWQIGSPPVWRTVEVLPKGVCLGAHTLAEFLNEGCSGCLGLLNVLPSTSKRQQAKH